jgi:hypothetical protein
MSLAIAFFAVRAAKAVDGGDCSRNPDSCDFQEKRTVLRSEIWSGADCNPLRWNGLPSDGFPIDENVLQIGPRAPVHFLTGACEMHRPGGNIDNGISELQKAQTVGLLPAQKNLAALFEGILHCRKLDGIDKKTLGSSLVTRDAFCMHRGMAKASFASVAFGSMELQYDAGASSLGAHIEKMSACYADYLHGGYDATCAVISAPSSAAVDEAATRVSDEVLTNYFGDSGGIGEGDHGVPPLKAMLARKLQMADASILGSTTLFAGLQQKNQLLVTSFQTLGSMFCLPTGEDGDIPCAGPIPSRVSKLYGSYERSVLRAENILGFVDQWVNGLYEYKGKDVRADLKVGAKALSEVLARVQRPVQPNELSLVDKMRLVKRDMAVLANSGDANRSVVKSLCSVYFCEVRNRNPLFFRRSCDQLDPQLGRKIADVNKLCDANVQRTFLAGDAGSSSYGVCAAAGFPTATMNKTSMTVAEVDDCMATYHK